MLHEGAATLDALAHLVICTCEMPPYKQWYVPYTSEGGSLPPSSRSLLPSGGESLSSPGQWLYEGTVVD